jgi:hypothetical protein
MQISRFELLTAKKKQFRLLVPSVISKHLPDILTWHREAVAGSKYVLGCVFSNAQSTLNPEDTS